MLRASWVSLLCIAALLTATGLVGAGRSDPTEVVVAEARLGNGDLGLIPAVAGLFILEVQAIQALGGGHPRGQAYPTEDERRAQARRQVDAFFAARDVAAPLRDGVRAACADTDPHDARACQRAGTASLERARVRREAARAWFQRLAAASAVPWLASLAMAVVDLRQRRRAVR